MADRAAIAPLELSGSARASPKSVTTTASVVRDEDVVRLEVAVHNPLRVRRGEPSPGIDEDREARAPRSRLRAQPSAQGPPGTYSIVIETLSSNVPVSCTVTTLGWVSRSERLRLPEEPRAHLGRHEVSVEDLDRDFSVDVRIVRRVDDAHSTATQNLEDDVSPNRRSAAEGLALRRLHPSVVA